MKTAKIYCEHKEYAFLDFYVTIGNKRYFLFKQGYRTALEKYFSKGVIIKDAINLTKAKCNEGLAHVMRKFPSYLKYVEKEYGVSILGNKKTPLPTV